MWSKSNSLSIAGECMPADDRLVRSLPRVFLYGVPGFEGGWPA